MNDRYEIDPEIKNVCNNILKTLTIPVIGCVCIFLIFSMFNRITDHPKSKWQPNINMINSISIEPKLEYSYQTILSTITIEIPSDFQLWVNAVDNSYVYENIPSSWAGANRNAGPKTVRLKFVYNNDKYVSFEVWFCEEQGVVSFTEEYQGDKELWVSFRTRYSEKLFNLLEKELIASGSSWKSSDPDKWFNNEYVGK